MEEYYGNDMKDLREKQRVIIDDPARDLTREEMKALLDNDADFKPSRKQRRAMGESVILKKKFEGRCIRGTVVERNGVTYNRYLHVGKGWRERRV